jgi:site-specific DNA-methyltransferase (adenine-specific)
MDFDYVKCGDCIELMKKIPDKSIDMILCDLPYGTTRNKWDSVLNFDELWTAYKRIIKNNGAIVLFCDGMFTAKLLTSNRQMWRYNLVWDKQRGCDFLNANVKPIKCHEDIAVFYKKKPVYNKQYWYSTPYKKTKNGSLSSNYGDRHEAFTESADGARNPLTILSFPKDASRVHPTQKPIPLLQYLIKTYTNEGDTVLDNCMGSGSTCIAAANTNRHYIGFEIEPKYFQIAKKRLYEADSRKDRLRKIQNEEHY